MYVRLKHALSALALEAVRRPDASGPRSAVGWLAAFCDLISAWDAADDGAGDRFTRPVLEVASRARRARAGDAGLRRVLDAGLLVRRDDLLSLPEGFRPHFAYMRRQVHRASAAITALDRADRRAGPRGDQAAVSIGATLFNAGLFFECHEFLEDVWRAAPPADRAFYHGLILIAAGFYHYEKGNLHGARIKLAQGIGGLQPYLPQAHGFRLDRWMEALAPWRTLVEAGQISGPLNPSEIPRIPLVRVRGPKSRGS